MPDTFSPERDDAGASWVRLGYAELRFAGANRGYA
jgi:hypothetical protein